MSDDKLKEKIRDIVQKISKHSGVKYDTKFSKLGMDSLDIMDVIVDIEEYLGFDIDWQGNNDTTINDIVEAISEEKRYETMSKM